MTRRIPINTPEGSIAEVNRRAREEKDSGSSRVSLPSSQEGSDPMGGDPLEAVIKRLQMIVVGVRLGSDPGFKGHGLAFSEKGARELAADIQAIIASVRDLETAALDATFSDRADDNGSPLTWEKITRAALQCSETRVRELEETTLRLIQRVRELDADRVRLDWLEQHNVEVRDPLPYGSRHVFFANVDDSYEGEEGPSDIRAKVDAALTRTPVSVEGGGSSSETRLGEETRQSNSAINGEGK